jgi:HK97 gp10 family phage protein
MIKVDTKLSGDLAGDLQKFEKKLKESVLFSGVAAMAKVTYDEVKANAAGANDGPHIKTGTLYSAIYRVYSPEKSTDDQKTYRVSWNHKKAPHGHIIEFGSSRAPAFPFVRPAFDHIQAAIDAGRARMAQRLADGVVEAPPP